jgi:prepilin-type N-terminal cleavage/methylation domain-containing protein
MKGIGHLPAMKTTKGFTIVELLIVIVVIGILAAVTIVAFNGITSKANQAKLSSDLANSVTRLKADAVDLTNAYPSSIAAANGGQGLPASSGTTYQYTIDNTANPATFCLTATNNGTSYFVTQDGGTPTAGACPGHDNGGGTTAVTNMFTNPNFETSTAGWTNPNSSTLLRDTSFTHSGGASLKVTLPTASAGISGTGVPSIPVNASNLVPGSTYTVSAYVYVPTATSITLSSSVQGSYASRVNGPSSTTTVKNTWVRLSNSFVAGASGSISLYFLNGTAATSGMVFWVDDAMLTQGSTLFNYGDGNYSANGWSWSGTNNLSTSSGPVL